MAEQILKGNRGQAVLVKKGEALPVGARPMTEREVMEVQEKRITAFKRPAAMRSFNKGQYYLGGSVCVSAYWIASTMRENFQLGNLRRFFVYAPCIAVPACVCMSFHEMIIRKSILLGTETSMARITAKGGLLQVFSGIVHPYMLATLTCVISARNYYTLPLPEAKEGGWGYMQLFRKVAPSRNIMLGLLAANVFSGVFMAQEMLNTYNKYLKDPTKNWEDEDEMGLDIDTKSSLEVKGDVAAQTS